jgi:hypothetical protein
MATDRQKSHDQLGAAGITSTTILAPNQVVTGVRGTGGEQVVLTGTSVAGSVSTGLVYVGPLSPTQPDGIHLLPPVFPGQTVTASTYYGPDTSVFNPSIGEGNVRLVGSYQYSESDVRNHGMLYQGPPTGGGTWTQIDVPSSAVGGKIVANTIAHSTMGDLVVGNYDLQGQPASGNAFIYDIARKTWTIFNFGSTDNLTTAYGIWQNGVGSSSYVIVGGTRDGAGLNKGFVVNYNAGTQAFSNLKLYSFMDRPTLMTHFEGITATPAGFNLAGGSSGSLALFASITVNADGSFSDATWIPYAVPGSLLTTGNSIYENVMMGIYALSGTKGVQSYVATFD